MNAIVSLFRSSIGRKFLMAITGLVLILFVVGHLVGNLQIFSHPDKINGYAHFLQSLGPVLWGLRLGLLACVAIHIWAAVTLTLENKAARGSDSYGVSKWLKATLASRYMAQSGLVILAFIVYHIAHFTLGYAGSETFKSNIAHYTMSGDFHLIGFPIVAKGQEVHDVYSMVYLGFANPWVSLFYIIATGLLSLHLLHGIQAMFQTIGWRNGKWSCCLQRASTLLCLLYFLGNLAIPGLILSGVAKPAAGTYAAENCACCKTNSSEKH